MTKRSEARFNIRVISSGSNNSSIINNFEYLTFMFHLKSTDVGNFKNGFLFCIEIFLTNLLEGKNSCLGSNFYNALKFPALFPPVSHGEKCGKFLKNVEIAHKRQ